MKRVFKHTYNFFLHLFAIIGVVLVGGFFAVRFHLTDVKGAVDKNSEAFGKMVMGLSATKNAKAASSDLKSLNDIDDQLNALSKIKMLRMKNLCQIDAIGYYSPINAKNIYLAFEKTQSDAIAAKMIFAANLRLKEAGRNSEVEKCENDWQKNVTTFEILGQKYASAVSENVFPWMNDEQWQTIKIAIAKDKDKIDQAAAVAGIEPRLIVASAIVEQLRLFYSQRELYKKFFEPLKILGNSNKISLGVMGIKEATAVETENHLKDKNSPFYLGENLENALDFKTADHVGERYNRLTTEGEYYYSYLYAALYLKEMMTQWKNAGFDIQYRPEIVATLFNVGFPQSKPNNSPKVGGSEIQVGDAKYSFGSLAYEFYYSGELLDEFPYRVQ